MAETPKVSVIVPMHNVESYVGDCLNSLLSQTFSDFEVIVVDDGSTDESVNRAKEIVDVDPRFFFIEQHHEGQSVARNKGIKAARGKYVAFLDADDYYVPDCLEKLYSRAEADNLEGVFFSAASFYDGLDATHSLAEALEHTVRAPGVLSGPDLFVKFEYSDDIWCPVVLQFIRRSMFEMHKLRFYEGIIHEDELFTATSLPLMKRVALHNESLYCRRIRPHSTMTKGSTFYRTCSLFRVVREMKQWLCETNIKFNRLFLEAFAHRVYWLTDVAVYCALDENKEDLGRFADTLSDAEFVDFEMNIMQRLANTKKIHREIMETKAYKLGHLITFIPEKLIDISRAHSRSK